MLNVTVQPSIQALDVAGKLEAGSVKPAAQGGVGTPAQFAEGYVVSGNATAGYKVMAKADDGTLLADVTWDCVFTTPRGVSLAAGTVVALLWKQAGKQPRILAGSGGGGDELPVVVSALGFIG